MSWEEKRADLAVTHLASGASLRNQTSPPNWSVCHDPQQGHVVQRQQLARPSAARQSVAQTVPHCCYCLGSAVAEVAVRAVVGVAVVVVGTD
jgi:hypothetical protein